MTDSSLSRGASLIGCAGTSIGRDVAAAFPGEGSHLERYARVLPAAEINSSFYRPHQASTYARWAAAVPDGFQFAVKMPRTVTHDAKLAATGALLDALRAQVDGLGDRLGCILVQLPPKLTFDAAIAEAFFDAVQTRFACMTALEARNPSWFGEAATALLRARGVTRVIADPPAGQPAAHVPTTADIYTRLHGAPRIYYSSYGDDYLAQLADDMHVHNAAGRKVWCIFDNTASGAASANALTLARALAQRGRGHGVMYNLALPRPA